ncbi:MAG: hypothetical protein K0Q47_149 [Sedimentibacter sp.]|jgi:hypothetical protein|nr:hypothetical protein [Sedimentibacter sp.]
MAGNLILNPNMLEVTDQNYDVLTSDCLDRTVQGKITDPKYYFYLGGCDFPDYPNGLPAGVTMSSFEYAGGELANDSVDNDPLISKSIMLDASNPLTNFGSIGKEHNPIYGGSGGVTQVVYIGQTEAKPFRFSCYCKCEDVVGNARVLFDVVGFDNTGSGTYLSYVSGTHDFQKLSELKTFSFPVKYAFLHFSVQNMSSGKAWFAKPLIEEIDMDLIVPDPDERVMNPIFVHTSNEVDTVAWETTNCERFEDIDLIYLNPYMGTMLKMTSGSSLQQNAIIVSDVSHAILNVKCTLRSFGHTVVKITLTERGRHRNKMNEVSRIYNISSDDIWRQIRLMTYSNVLIEKIDLKIEHISGDDILICNASITENTIPPSNISEDKVFTKIESDVEIPNLPNYDDTLSIKLENELSPKYLELNPNDEFNGVAYLTNGMIGKFVPYKELSGYSLYQNKKLTKIDDDSYYLTPWDPNIVELKTPDERLRNFLPAPHINETEDVVIEVDGHIKAGDRRYYCATAYNEFGESTKSNDVRYIIPDSYSDYNVINLEITPVKGATGYRIYMSKAYDNEDPNMPGDWAQYGADYVLWGENALLDTISHEQLRSNGYFYYDYGSNDDNMKPGTPSMTVNTAKFWYKDDAYQTVHLTSTYYSKYDIYAGCLIEDYIIQAIKYLPHKRKLYLATNKGVFESDDKYTNKLYKVLDSNLIHSMSYVESGLKYYTNANIGFLQTETNKYYLNYVTGVLTINDLNNTYISSSEIEVPDAILNGFSKYYDKFITHNKTNGTFIIFEENGTIDKILPFVITDFEKWDITGSILSVLMNDGVVKLFGIFAEEYYGRFNSLDTAYRGLHFPALCKPRLPDESVETDDHEALVNGTFTVWNGQKTSPEGFHIIYDTQSVVNLGQSDDVAIVNTKAHVYKTLVNSWGSIYKQDVEVDADSTYIISLYTKASIKSFGSLGVKVKNAQGQGEEIYYSFDCETEYEKRSFEIHCDENATAIDFRVFYYGTDDHPITYYTNMLSVMLKEDQPKELDFSYISNGDFLNYGQSGSSPDGWSHFNDVSSAIENSSMGSIGKAWKLTLPIAPAEPVIITPRFSAEQGDNLELKFLYKTTDPSNGIIGCGIEYFDINNNYIDSNFKDISISGNNVTNEVLARFDINYNSAYCHIKIVIKNYNCISWFENMTALPYINIDANEKVVNPRFEEGLYGWNHSPNVYIGDSIRNLEGGYKELIPNCAICKIDSILDPDTTYTELRQEVFINQLTNNRIHVKHKSRSVSKTPTGNIPSRCDMVISYMDNTSTYNNFELSDGSMYNAEPYLKLPYDNWTNIDFYIDPIKPVKSIIFIFATGFGHEGTLYVKSTSIEEITQELPFNDIDLQLSDYSLVNLNLRESFYKEINGSAKLLYNGNPVYAKNKNIDIEISPVAFDYIFTTTNKFGKAKFKFNIINFVGILTVTAKLGGVSVSKTITVTTGTFKSKLRNFLRPKPIGLPDSISNIYLEVIAQRTKKPVQRVHDRIGTWEVFRRSVVSPAQTEDYDIHWAENSSEYAFVYPNSLYIDYYDYLSFYPSYGAATEIAEKRSEWRCVEPTGISQPFGDGRSYYNWKDPECRAWFAGRMIQRTSEVTNWSDGTYLDDFWAESYEADGFDWGAKASWLLNFRTIKERLENQGEGLRLTAKEYHKYGLYFTSNYGDSRKIDYSKSEPDLDEGSKTLADKFDGYLREVWFYGDLRPPIEARFQISKVRDEIEFLRYCNKNNKFVACLAGQLMHGYDARIFALATLLFGKGDYTYFAWRSWDFSYWHYGMANHQTILPEQTIYVGEPKSEYVYDNDGFFSREFDNCIALLNVNPNANSKTYTLPDGVWFTTRGQMFTGSITVTFQKAYVLVKERP